MINKTDLERKAIAKLREGTEVLRTGGGVELTAPECNALIIYIQALEGRLEGMLHV